MISKKKIALFSIIGILSISGIAFGSYKMYQNNFHGAYKDDYTFEEINTLILTKQQESIQKFEEQLFKSSQKTNTQLSRSGSISIHAEAISPFGSGNTDFNIGNYIAAFQKGSLALGMKNFDTSGNFNIMNEIQSMSGGFESLDLKVFQSGAYLKANNIYVSENKILENIPREFINTLNGISASGSFLHIPYDAASFDTFGEKIDDFKKSIYEQQEKQKESMSGAINYLKTHALFEVSKQEGTRYYLQPSKSFCAFAEAGKTQEKLDSPTIELPYMGNSSILAENISQKATQIDFSTLQDCESEAYTSFLTKEFQNISIYIEKNATQGHLMIEFLNNDKTSGFVDTHFTLTGIGKAIVSLTPSQSGSLTGSGVYLEIEQKMLSGYIDIVGKDKSLSLHFTPQRETQETTFSGNYNTQKIISIPVVSFGEEKEKQEQLKMENKSTLTGSLKKNKIQFEIHLTDSTSSDIDPSRNAETKSQIKIEIQYENTENLKKGSISVMGSQELMRKPVEASMHVTWEGVKQGSSNTSNINFSVTSNQNISGNIDIEIHEDILQNPQEYLQSPTNIIEMVDFEKKVLFEARKIARLKKIKEAQDNRNLKNGRITLNAYEIEERNTQTEYHLRRIMGNIEMAILDMEKIKLSDFIMVATSKRLENIGIIKIGRIHLNQGELSKSDIGDSYGDEIQIAILETDDGKNQFYQLKGNIIGKDNTPSPVIKGNYVKIDKNYPESLFEESK